MDITTDSDHHSVETVAREAYGQLAPDFYDPLLHPTTSFFGSLIDYYLHTAFPPLAPGRYLEVGAGRSHIASLMPRSSDLLLTDISSPMLTHSHNLSSRGRLHYAVASAFALPVRSHSLDGVFSFLGDTYALQPFFAEVARTLKNGGFLLFITPTATWGHTLRSLLNVAPTLTPMKLRDSRTLLVPSVLYTDSALISLARQSDLLDAQVSQLSAPAEMALKEAPAHISLVLSHLITNLRSFPILTALLARVRANDTASISCR